ncbi:head decoration protein [Magnetococcus sp. PR-3]|uniref:head decoration protein n=1 Tax=Magnetococcus sp. PR-3 TaxID=3120355 RepID=UPI002FCE5741
MPEMNETNHAGEFVVSEGNGSISRETVTILNGRTLVPGTVLGKITSSGKYREIDPAATSGAEVAVAILYDHVDASAGDAGGVVIHRLAEANAGRLVFDAAVTDAQKTTALGQLADQNIIAR